MNILFIAHSNLRWLILFVAVLAVIKFAVSWFRNSKFENIDHKLMSGFRGLMDLQATIGFFSLIVMLWNRNQMIESNNPFCAILACFFPAYAIIHGVIMLIATVVVHVPARWKNINDKARLQNNLAAILISLLLMLMGTFVLRFRPALF